VTGLAVGVDLGGTNARAALLEVDGTGRILAERRAPVVDRSPAAVADLVASLVYAVKQEAGATDQRAVGVGFAGMLRGWSGVVANAPNFGWREVDFRALLRARLGPTVELYNDVNAIAYGETTFGAARGARDVLCVFVGTGIGGGLVADGRLYAGAHHLAGEFGHMKVVRPGPEARRCGCGQRGCIEAYASGRHLAERAQQEIGELLAGASSLAVELAGAIERVHAGHLDEAARRGDPYATALWSEVTPLLGAALANAVTLLNPACVVLGGTVWEGAPELRRLTLAAYAEAVNAPSGEGARLVDGALGDNAGVLGAAALIAGGVVAP
jgi:glucokinase